MTSTSRRMYSFCSALFLLLVPHASFAVKLNFSENASRTTYLESLKDYKLKIYVGYDESFRNAFGGDQKANEAIEEIMSYVKKYFIMPPLNPKLHIEVVDIAPIAEKIPSTSSNGKKVLKYAMCGVNQKADLYLFLMTKKLGSRRNFAHRNTACSDKIWKRAILARITKKGKLMDKSLIPTKLIARTLGIKNDYKKVKGKYVSRPDYPQDICIGIGSIMDVFKKGQSIDPKWSFCSAYDLQKFFQQCIPICLQTVDGSSNPPSTPCRDIKSSGQCKKAVDKGKCTKCGKIRFQCLQSCQLCTLVDNP